MEDLLKEQLKVATTLQQVLESESEALQSRDADRLRTLSTEKIELTTTLEQLAARQAQQLAACGLSQTPGGLGDYARQLPDAQRPAFNKTVAALGEVLARSKRQNQINGQMIAASRQSVDLALSILRGQNGSRELTYGPGGETVATSASGPLARA